MTLSLSGYGYVFWFFLSVSEFDNRLFSAINDMNDMLLDMLAAVARRDYEQRRERQKQGIEKARKDGKYKERKPNQARHDAIIRLIESGSSWTQVQKVLGCSRGTISSAIKRKSRQFSSE
ncbi:recombinase family protein [Escherichia coli]|nr:recombinase family protein [Escherichia coli]